ncbi:MAG: hypothetical protein II982_03545, partial [Clostridia bacterium]|nr:hypothetical protein [Clostridia bacterium]
NVKYVDSFGNVQDKGTSIADVTDTKIANKFAYVTENNDVLVYFPKSLSDDNGIVLSKDDVNIELKPVVSLRSALVSEKVTMESSSKAYFEPTKLQNGRL